MITDTLSVSTPKRLFPKINDLRFLRGGGRGQLKNS